MALTQEKFVFGTETGTITTHGTLPNNPDAYSGNIAANDVNQNISRDYTDQSTFFIRFLIQSSGGTIAANTVPTFQRNLNGGAWGNITANSTIVKAVATSVFADGADMTQRLQGSGVFDTNNDGATHDGVAGGAQMDIAANGNNETMCAIQLVSADLAPGDIVGVRITTSPVALTGYTVNAQITITQPSIPFTGDTLTGVLFVAGQAPTLNAGASVESVTAQLSFIGQAPTWAAFYDFTASTVTGKITLSGQAATIQAGASVATTTGQIVFAGQVATFSATADISAETTAGQIKFAGQTTTWQSTEDVTEIPATGELRFNGFVPDVDTGGAELIRFSPSTVLSSSNLQDTNLVTPPVRLEDLADETSGSPGPDEQWWTAIDPEADVEARFGFPAPPGNLEGTQTIRLWIRGTSLPCRQVKVELWEAGVKKVSETIVDTTSIDGQLVTLEFQPEELSDITGADVEVKVSWMAA